MCEERDVCRPEYCYTWHTQLVLFSSKVCMINSVSSALTNAVGQSSVGGQIIQIPTSPPFETNDDNGGRTKLQY